MREIAKRKKKLLRAPSPLFSLGSGFSLFVKCRITMFFSHLFLFITLITEGHLKNLYLGIFFELIRLIRTWYPVKRAIYKTASHKKASTK